MAGILLIVLPLVVYLHSLIMFQTLIGNFPMQVRWKAHRHMMLQSLGFQSEFAGRIATKVMQTALSVRESVMKTLDVFVYVLVYFPEHCRLGGFSRLALGGSLNCVVCFLPSHFKSLVTQIKGSVSRASGCTLYYDGPYC